MIANGTKLQKLVYQDIRSEYKLPAQMACNVPRQVGATYKGLLTKLKQNQQAIAKGFTKKRFKGLDAPPKFVPRTCSLNYMRDFSFKPGQQVSIITLQGRIVVSYAGYNKHLELQRAGAKIGGAKIWYSKPSKTYYLLVSIELTLPSVEPIDLKRVVGVDVGRRYLAVTTDIQNQAQFFSGKESLHKAKQYQRARKSLQHGNKAGSRATPLFALERHPFSN